MSEGELKKLGEFKKRMKTRLSIVIGSHAGWSQETHSVVENIDAYIDLLVDEARKEFPFPDRFSVTQTNSKEKFKTEYGWSQGTKVYQWFQKWFGDKHE